MKTRNFILFVLTAVVCGAFLCADSQARVCFAGDESCEVGGFFDALPEKDLNDSACVAEGYIENKTCKPGEITYTCPYKSSYKKCCGAEYKYEACVYPLEQTGRCGTRVSCKCPDDYSVTSEYASNNYCQPGGGYCMANNGVDDEIRYKTCTCDPSVFVEEGETCPNNQEVSKTCTGIRWTNAQKTAKGPYTRVDCYCKRGSISKADPYKASKNDEYPFSNCTYGHKGTNTCIDSNTKREYYNECKSPKEACIDDGYEYVSCSSERNCTTENKVYWNGSWQYLTSYYCILGDMCPYPTNPSLYKCVFDKASWCTEKGYSKTSSTAITNGAKCTTDDGYVGTYEVCPANDGSALFYYRCNLPCEQEVRRAYSKGYLTQDTSMIGTNGQVVGYVRTDAGGAKHIYFIDDIVLPKANMGTKGGGWAHINNKVDYASINGMWALGGLGMKYNDGSDMFAGCAKERGAIFNSPTIKFDNNLISKWNKFLNEKMSDIQIQIWSSNPEADGAYGEEYNIGNDGDVEWYNVALLSDEYLFPPSSGVSDWGHYKHLDKSNRVILYNQLIIKGRFGIRVSGMSYTKDGKTCAESGTHEVYDNTCAYMPSFRFLLKGNAVVKFDGATIYSDRFKRASWQGEGGGTMLFYNTKMGDSNSYVGTPWHYMNIGLSNSDVKFTAIKTAGFGASNTSRRFGGYSDISGVQYPDQLQARCKGVYLMNNSTLTTTDPGWMGDQTKIYVDYGGGTIKAEKPIYMNSKNTTILCLYGGKATFGSTTYNCGGTNKCSYARFNQNWYNSAGWIGKDGFNSQSSNSYTTGTWYWKFDHGNSNGNYPCSTGGTCDGKCNSDFDPHCQGTGCVYLCTGCYNCQITGMGY
ncbi:MAG: hypothetical protein IJZ59_05680 [Alphaproteobacteria bacterium]|nr:hypothetical protein [Alphaproteobacteria bacterium]